MSFRRFRFLGALALLPLAACAARVPWRNPHVPESQWSRDWDQCRRAANDSVLGYGNQGPPPGPFQLYDRDRDKRAIDAQVAACMADLGYVPVNRTE